MTTAKFAALGITGALVLALGYLNLRSEHTLAVPAGALAGELDMSPCTYDTEAGSAAADCGTLVVPENRRDGGSDLIALPVIRIRASGGQPAEPIFRLNGGPGATNLEFPQASRLTDKHDVVLVGYRGVDGSRKLDCPEVTSALKRSADLAGAESLRDTTEAFSKCAKRLTGDGVDLTGYSIAQRVDDLEAARTALGYQRINLISTSAGTRTAMVYSWRHPASLHRSVMIAANPPGHFVWNPRITDSQFAQYTRLCAQDAKCANRTDDLAATIRAEAGDIPSRWGVLPIKEGNVRVAGMYGMFHSTGAAAPLNAPTMVDAWLAAKEGDAAGMWAMSVLTDLTIPTSFVWGEFASFGMIDAPAAERYYGAGGDPGSTLGNAAADMLWGGADGFYRVWPDSPDNADYQALRRSDVETLVISGTVDFTTPAELSTDELMPSLAKGRQVTLAGMGHTADFWGNQQEAGARLLTRFFDTGEVDESGYRAQAVDFKVGFATMTRMAWMLAGAAAGGALVAVLLLGWMALRVRRRGGFGPRAGAWLRFLTPLPLGIGGWLLAVCLMWTVWPRLFIGDPVLAVPSVALAVGLGTWLAWSRRDRPRRLGFVAALAGAFLGGALGFGAATGLTSLLATIAGAAATANLALLALDRPRGLMGPRASESLAPSRRRAPSRSA
ncbi:alpha/beta hydrolase [Micromonospora sp. CPCC 205371]|nr:alpha/beta hydrolase [Micromonospora sp. CPCC 205371]